MDLFFVLKLLVVLLFLVMFLRNSKIVWGIGLLTVSTAFLLDTIWTTFGREEVLADVGFFFYVLSGALFAGAAIWFWSVLRPLVDFEDPARDPDRAVTHTDRLSLPDPGAAVDGDETYADPRELFEEIRTHLGPADVRDLIFDLQLNENDVLAPDQEMTRTITRILNRAHEEGKMGDLALAVERVLTPVPAESLPRREKLTINSPPTVLRHYLLAHYSLDELMDLARRLGIDVDRLQHGTKPALARDLLLYLQRRNQMGQLIARLHAAAPLQEEG
jgi:hypothetical protein